MAIEVGKLLGFLSSLRVAHLNADTATNEHKAIGELYDDMDELTDDYAEICLGKHGGKATAASFAKAPTDDNAAMIQAGSDCVSDLRATCKVGVDDDLLNILADMDTALNKARYLLKAGSAAETESPGMGQVMGKLRGIAK
jgi:hypothetical protein